MPGATRTFEDESLLEELLRFSGVEPPTGPASEMQVAEMPVGAGDIAAISKLLSRGFGKKGLRSAIKSADETIYESQQGTDVEDVGEIFEYVGMTEAEEAAFELERIERLAERARELGTRVTMKDLKPAQAIFDAQMMGLGESMARVRPLTEEYFGQDFEEEMRKIPGFGSGLADLLYGSQR